MNPTLLNRLRRLAEQEIYDAIYRDHLTGTHNRRAFEAVRFNAVALVDLDSLKYVNDTFGLRAGDNQLRLIATLLLRDFGARSVYRVGGDEFAVVADHAMALRAALLRLRDEFAGFSFGVGFTREQAEAKLKTDRLAREERGLRATRGGCPPWITPGVRL